MTVRSWGALVSGGYVPIAVGSLVVGPSVIVDDVTWQGVGFVVLGIVGLSSLRVRLEFSH